MPAQLRPDQIALIQLRSDPLGLFFAEYQARVLPVPETMMIDAISHQTKDRVQRGDLTLEDATPTFNALLERLTLFAWQVN